MLINCFCSANQGNALNFGDEASAAPRPRPVKVASAQRPKKSRMLSRQSSGGSRASSSISSNSNESISKLPPCKRQSDPKIEAMMMPLPYDPRPSRCLRLSHPKTYSSLVSDMKASRGCRDWKDFAVFDTDDVDMTVSAEDAARKRALDYEKRLRQFNYSFGSEDDINESAGSSVSI